MANYQTIKRKILNTRMLPFLCFYCGEPANQREHVFPKSYSGEDTPTVWACEECNNLAGSKLFPNIYEKTDYIQQKIRKKYHWCFNTPDWDDEELEELGRNLKKHIKRGITTRNWVERRLSWQTTPNVLIALKILQEKENGKSSVEEIAKLSITERRELRDLLCLEG